MFTVRLLRAPDYAPDDYFVLCKLLHSFPLPGWTFQATETEHFLEDAPYFQNGRQRPEDIHFHYDSPVEKKMYDSSLRRPLSFQELFDVCSYYRHSQSIIQADFVILLTDRPNALNWFSAYDDNRNIFIHTGGWDTFMQCQHQFPVAYEVIANVLQSQMELNAEGGDECLHQETIGCMNDFCLDKSQIAFKLRTADICAACSERLHRCEVPDHLVAGAAQGFEALRKQMLFSQGFKRHAGPGVLEVTWAYEFRFPSLGNLSFKLSHLSRILYAFFLHHSEGVVLANLVDHREELLAMYGRIAPGEKEAQVRSVERLINALSGSFNENRARINSEITSKLGGTIAAPYLISGERGGEFAIKLPRGQVAVLPK